MEKILLCYTGIFRCKFRKSVRIILRQHTLYPYINRESLCAVHSVKEHALSNLWSHTFYLTQSLSCLVKGHFRNTVKVCRTGRRLFCGIGYVLCPESASEI